MSKKIGLVLIILALVVSIAYVAIGVGNFEDCPIKTTTPTEVVKKEYKAKLVYNSLMYNSGAYEYSVQAYVNVEKVAKNATVTERMAITQQSKDAISSIKKDWESYGYKIETHEDYFVSATIAYYEDYDQLALANGQTGYVYEKSDATIYRGWIYNKIVSERTTGFKQESGSILNKAEETLNSIDGITLGDVSLVYNYGTMYKTTTISSDADQIYQLNDKETGLYTVIHEFGMTNDNRGRVITLVQTSPNVYTWYLLPIVCSMFIAGLTLLVSGARRSK